QVGRAPNRSKIRIISSTVPSDIFTSVGRINGRHGHRFCAGYGDPRTNPQTWRRPERPTIAGGHRSGLREPAPQPSRRQHLARSLANAQKARPWPDFPWLEALSLSTEPTPGALSHHWQRPLPKTVEEEAEPALLTPPLPQRPVPPGLQRVQVSLLR